ncbi:[histone H3]-lysine(4) N-trimethyltransferase [Ranunculus cassubicifolius]
MHQEEKKRFCCSKTKEDVEQALIFKCAELILSWLSPSDLASISSTCKTLRQVSNSITIRRSLDAARNFEKHPIPFINTIDSQPYSYFIYTPVQIFGLPSLPSQQWGQLTQSRLPPILYPEPTSLSFVRVENHCGCVCDNCLAVEKDGETQCPCSRLKPEFMTGLDVDSGVMTECGPSCACELACANRLTQRGVLHQLRIVKEERKGWGLHAAQLIPQGDFICEYAGELLSTPEARRRQQKYDELSANGHFSSALLVVREHLPSGEACFRINIDATRVGNIARFINHSCDGGNLMSVLVRISGALVPRLCFFASRDILEGEELLFSYGDVRGRPNGLRCCCGSSGCFGVLPSENT